MKRGFSLIEILLVVSGISFLIILVAALPNSINLVTLSRNQSLAREIAAKQIEETRQQQYINLALGTQNLTDSRINLLPEGRGEREISDCDISICLQSEEVKKVTVKVSWNQDGSEKGVKLVTLISEGGLNQ